MLVYFVINLLIGIELRWVWMHVVQWCRVCWALVRSSEVNANHHVHAAPAGQKLHEVPFLLNLHNTYKKTLAGSWRLAQPTPIHELRSRYKACVIAAITRREGGTVAWRKRRNPLFLLGRRVCRFLIGYTLRVAWAASNSRLVTRIWLANRRSSCTCNHI